MVVLDFRTWRHGYIVRQQLTQTEPIHNLGSRTPTELTLAFAQSSHPLTALARSLPLRLAQKAQPSIGRRLRMRSSRSFRLLSLAGQALGQGGHRLRNAGLGGLLDQRHAVVAN